ncbi:hypothetical protein V6N11_066315 [Hibiscus sabdariffa]|uniref:non-specific serine/threonine protein kinase n=2 Tax=Hibiscus sabdariffa TaxID=183260 RepID=A0ABR2AA02_9ROSI
MKTHSKNPVFVSLLSFIFLLYSFAQFCYASSDTLRQMPDPDNECELYNFCGNYSTCDQFDSRKCVCLEGFRPKSQDQWDARNWHGGCVRKIELQCPSTDDGTSRGKGKPDGFKKIRCTKLPDLENLFSPAGDLDTCRRHCLENCSCTAYAFIPGIRCMIWTGDLVDLQRSQQGGSLEFFYRLHHSELGCLAATIWLVWRYKTKLKVSSKLCCKDDDVAVFDVSKNKSKEFTTDLSRPTDILIDGNLVGFIALFLSPKVTFSELSDEPMLSCPATPYSSPSLGFMNQCLGSHYPLFVSFIDIGHRFSSSVRRAAINNTLASSFQGGHPILTQWVLPLGGLSRVLVGNGKRANNRLGLMVWELVNWLMDEGVIVDVGMQALLE